LAKIYKLTEKTTILLHYIEKQGEEQKIDRALLKNTDVPQSDLEALTEVAKEETELVDENQIRETESSSKTSNIEDKLKSVLVKDLFVAIGINEKYLFASELFNGNIDEFTASVKALNELENLEQASAFLKELSSMYNWDAENESAIDFFDLVERRFSQP